MSKSSASVHVLAGLVLAVLAAGCSSGSRGSPASSTPQPLLTGKAVYFDGRIVADARLGPFRLQDPSPPLDRTAPGPGDGEPVPIRDGGFGGRGERDAGTGFPRGPAEQGAFGESGGRPGPRRGGAGGGFAATGGLPRQTMTVTIRSQSESPTILRVVEVKSALGNFVPVPEHFTLPPKGTQVLEAMRSSYPEAIDELELLVVLRTQGREESQVLKLRPGGPALSP